MPAHTGVWANPLAIFDNSKDEKYDSEQQALWQEGKRAHGL